ncbi:MAG TPA: hypothetical protein IGS17_13665 [Oscillatoriales cyanobacterium M59_W2019_021]|nr:MAG: hypothetical protein D6728_14875 [Cyanobacteria bacterium J055]HIK30766.1 hypothetical protein [Oscillatoriales cyanobacterium M4454_W2019_049]HIK51951.1 hypothetical protein [Oscillatoriales cyanobacterium M59_W2019_021]
MLELLVGFTLIGSFAASVINPPQKPKPKPSESLKTLEAMLLVAVLDKSFNDTDREKINKAIEALKS